MRTAKTNALPTVLLVVRDRVRLFMARTSTRTHVGIKAELDPCAWVVCGGQLQKFLINLPTSGRQIAAKYLRMC